MYTSDCLIIYNISFLVYHLIQFSETPGRWPTILIKPTLYTSLYFIQCVLTLYRQIHCKGNHCLSASYLIISYHILSYPTCILSHPMSHPFLLCFPIFSVHLKCSVYKDFIKDYINIYLQFLHSCISEMAWRSCNMPQTVYDHSWKM